MDFSGKLVLVTGAARGSGRAIAREFARRGARVIVNYFHSRTAAEEFRAELEHMGAFAGLIRASVAKQDQVVAMFDTITAEHGYLDILVNNAAAGALLPTGSLVERDWDRAVDTNIKGALWCAQHATPLMRARGGGAIVNLSSMGANFVLDNYLTLGTTKAAVEALTRYLAAELAHERIRVNAASCSNIDGDVLKQFPNAEELAHMIAAASPLGRLPSEREYASVVLFLASDEASWITGQTVLADGGLSLGYGATTPSTLASRGRPLWLTLAPMAPPPMREHAVRAEHAAAPPVQARSETAIAIVGMGVVTPGASDPEQLWTALNKGVGCFAGPGTRFDMATFHDPNRGAEDRTHAARWGFAPTDLSNGDQDYAVAWLRHALGQALVSVARDVDDRVTLIVGGNASTQHLEEALVSEGLTVRGSDELKRTTDRRLRHTGTSPHELFPIGYTAAAAAGLLPADTELLTVDAACSSALYALDLAVRRLRAGSCDVAVSAGVHVLNPTDLVLFAKTGALSTDDDTRPFDPTTTGTLFSDGAAVVVLKTLDRARADGDEILGIVDGIGLSSDGRGKSVFAPNTVGQRLAIERALNAAEVEPRSIGLIVAHATGTPTGDTVELDSLTATYAAHAECPVVSNKSVVGHTGWAAGLVSVIHAVLAMRHSTIPAQRLTQPTDLPKPSPIQVPREPLSWLATPGQARRAAVSAFGFGGTNAHVILSEDIGLPANVPGTTATSVTEPIVLVGWTAELPGSPTNEEVAQWLIGTAPSPPIGYGDHPALPSLDEIKAPPGQVRQWDRTQILALHCVRKIEHLLAAPLDRDRVGVIAAHCGPTRNMTLYSQRIHLADLRSGVATTESATVERTLDKYAGAVRSLISPAAADSEAGKMANVIAGRIAGRFDLRGPTMTVDSGMASTFHAIEIAGEYLRAGDIDLALVVAVNGNSLPEIHGAAHAVSGRLDAPAEGAFLLVLTRRDIATRDDMAIVATLANGTATSMPVTSMEHLLPPGRTYLAADPAMAILRTALSGRPATIRHREHTTGAQLDCAVLPANSTAGRERYAVHWRDAPPLTDGKDTAEVPTNCVVLTCGVTSLSHIEILQHNTLIVAVESMSATELISALDSLEWSPRHLRVVVNARDEGSAFDTLLTAHEQMFLVAQRLVPALTGNANIPASATTVVLDAFDAGTPRASTGLFTGFAKALAAEFADAVVRCVITTETDPSMGLALLARESDSVGDDTVVSYRHGRRQIPGITRLDHTSVVAITPPAVIVATGGARGITAAVVNAIVGVGTRRIWLLGANDIDGYPPSVFEGDDAAFEARRVDHLRRRCAEDPTLTPAAAKDEYDRMGHAREARAWINRMRARCGGDQVRYLTCDLADPDAVRATAAVILAEDPQIDLVVHGAGRNRPAQLARKTLADFRTVRDAKVRGHHYLREALGTQPGCRWINMGSLAALLGLPGEVDYVSANDFLASAATWAHERRGEAETTVEWTRWDSTGLAASPLMRSLLTRNSTLTAMSTTEGIDLFRAELADRSGSAVVAHIGAEERPLLGSLHTASRPAFFRDCEVARSATELIWERTLESLRDRYLNGHLVDGRPTMPGSFAAEIAAEIAQALVPNTVATAFEFLRFHRWLRLHPTKPRPFHIVARLTDSAGMPRRVRVLIQSDIVSPSGHVVKTVPHFEVTVVLSDRLASPPILSNSASSSEPVPLEQPKAIPGITFSAPFNGLRDLCPNGSRLSARYLGNFPVDDTMLTECETPAVLIDAMVQLCGHANPGTGLPTRAVSAVGRIDRYWAGNDRELATTYPTGVDVRCHVPGGAETAGPVRCYAVGPDERILVALHAVEFTAFDSPGRPQ